METDEILAELKSATGWQKVIFDNDYFIFDLTIQDMRVIKGLKQGNDCLYLDFPSFIHIPLSFMVHVGNTVHQYWTIHNRLHRTKGRPAYVAYDPDKDRIIRRWHWNGLLHRVNGPAKEMVKGYKVEDIEGMDGFYQESWDFMSLEWHTEGFPSRFPCVSSAELENGTRIRSKKTNLVQSPRPDLVALFVERAAFEWHVTKEKDELRPCRADIMNLAERYDEGKVIDRECSLADITWKRGNDTFDHTKMTKFNEEISKGDMFLLMNLWGELYQDDETEFLLLAEYDRIGKDEE